MKKPFYIMAAKERGYALLLGLLIVVVIGMMMYFGFWWGPVYRIGGGRSGINPPWRQWEKLRVRVDIKKEAVGKSVKRRLSCHPGPC